MVLLENSEILKARNNILDTIFATDMEDFNEVIKALESNEEIKDNNLITINWDEDEIKGFTKDEISYIQKFRDFYQSIFNEYQLRSIKLLADTTKEIPDYETLNTEERREKLEGLLQNKVFNLLINMFIKCGNFGAKVSNDEWNKRMEELENIYIDGRNKLLNAETKISSLESEIDRLKNKKFLGIFKVN